jgi:hypothetical protein
MHVGNIGAAFAAYIASKGSVPKSTKAEEAEAHTETEAVVNVELPADAGLTEARAQITARDIQAGLAALALNIANSEKNSTIAALIR